MLNDDQSQGQLAVCGSANQKTHGRSISVAAGWTIRTAPCTGKTSPSRRECTPGIRHHDSWGPRFFTAHSQTVALHAQLYDTLWHYMKTAIINHDILEYSPFVDTLQLCCLLYKLTPVNLFFKRKKNDLKKQKKRLKKKTKTKWLEKKAKKGDLKKQKKQ